MKKILLILLCVALFSGIALAPGKVTDPTGNTIGVGDTIGTPSDFIVDSTPKLPKPGDKYNGVEVVSSSSGVTGAETILKIANFNPDIFGAVVVSIPGKKDLPNIKLIAKYGIEESYTVKTVKYRQVDYNFISDDNGAACPKDWKPYGIKQCYIQKKKWIEDGVSEITKTKINYYSTPEVARNRTAYIKLNSTWNATLGERANDILIKYGTWIKELLWWNVNWQYKRPITITNNAAVNITDKNYAINISVDGTSLTSVQADCDDLRVVFDNGITTTELDRNIMGACNGDFNVAFNIHTDIAPAGTNAQHYLYYGNPLATTPTTDENILIWNDANVIVWGDFDNALGGQWQATAGAADFNSEANGSYKGGALVCAPGSGDTIAATVDIEPMNAGTIEFWLKFDTIAGAAASILYTDPATDNLELYVGPAATTFAVTSGAYSPMVWVTEVDNILNEWHYYRLTFGPEGRYAWRDTTLLAGNAALTQGVGNTAEFLKLCYTTYDDTGFTIDRFKITSGTQLNYPTIPMPQYDINYNTLLPTATLGAEETYSALTDVNLTVFNPTTTTKRTNYQQVKYYVDGNCSGTFDTNVWSYVGTERSLVSTTADANASTRDMNVNLLQKNGSHMVKVQTMCPTRPDQNKSVDVNFTLNLYDQNISYSGFTAIGDKNFFKTLNYDLNYFCGSTGNDVNINISVNDVNYIRRKLSCTASTINVLGTIVGAIPDGNKEVKATRVAPYSADSLEFSDRNFWFQTYAVVHLHFFDENSLANLQTTFTIDGNSWTTSATGDINFDYNNNPGTLLVYVDKANYGVRYFDLNIWNLYAYDKNLGLLPSSLGKDTAFLFKDNNGVVLANTYIELRNVKSLDTNIFSRRKTDASGQTSIFLNPNDGNYYFRIGTEDYNSVTVTVQKPKEESSGAEISPVDFDITVSGAGFGSYPGNTAPKVIYILPNTVEEYAFLIADGNTFYLSRSYLLALTGNPKTYSLQPYLVGTDTGTNVWFYTKNTVDGSSLANVKITITRNIGVDVNVLISSGLVDSSGTLVTSLLLNTDYLVNFYYAGSLIYIATARPAQTNQVYYVYLKLPSTDWNGAGYLHPMVTFTPSTGYVIYHSPVQITTLVTDPSCGITKVHILVKNGDTNVYDLTDTNAIGCGKTFNISISTVGLNISKGLQAYTWVYQGSNISTSAMSYFFVSESDYNNSIIHTLRDEMRTEFSCPADSSQPCFSLMLISLLITTAVCIWFAMKVMFNYSSMALLAMGFISFFVYLNWIPLYVGIFMGFAAVATLIFERGR